jgi:hypothetical protein
MNSVKFSCTSLKGTNKAGILPKDKDGYYTMPIGGLDVYNSAGEFYSYQAAKSLFEASSSFMRRVSTGVLKGELGHPKPSVGQSMESFANRVMSIEEKNVCAHFAEVWLDFNSVKGSNGKPIVAIMAKVAPSGPLASSLERSLENAKEDVCFSIRAFTEDKLIAGVNNRALQQIVTFDAVTEPGISTARKYFSPSLEARSETVFTQQQLVDSIVKPIEGYATESTKLTVTELFKMLNWQAPDPKFLKW